MTPRFQARLIWGGIVGLAVAVGAFVYGLPMIFSHGSAAVQSEAGPSVSQVAPGPKHVEQAPGASAREAEIVAMLRGDVAMLRERVARLREAQAQAVAAARPLPGIEDVKREASDWRDRGDATPATALETLLWASAGGDVGRVKELITLKPEVAAEAEALWAGLPQEVRGMFESPLDLVATLTAVSVPLGTAKMWATMPNQGTPDPADLHVLIEVVPPEGASRRILLEVEPRQVTEGEPAWRVAVPPSALIGYKAMLSAELPP